MKGILLAGGRGTRLYPMTAVISKQLLPVYDKPMIYYSISVLMLSEIRDILLISGPDELPLYKKLLGDGSQFGLRIKYKVQLEPEGIAQALIIAEDFVGEDPVALMLGDNLFWGQGLSSLLLNARTQLNGAHLFAYHVPDPERFGVVNFDERGRVKSIEEKPQNPMSNYAITGLYFFDNQACEHAKSIEVSDRGELEISSVNKIYMDEGRLDVTILGRGYSWLDTGTPQSLLEASQFVHIMEERQGLKIACLEEIAFNKNWISQNYLKSTSIPNAHGHYKHYLQRTLQKDTPQRY